MGDGDGAGRGGGQRQGEEERKKKEQLLYSYILRIYSPHKTYIIYKQLWKIFL